MFTITEAAKKAGVSRAAIHKAIKQGRLSATKTDNGNYQIDSAELFRVYKKVDNHGLHGYTENAAIDNQLIAQQLEFTQKLLLQVETERDSLKYSVEYLQHNLNQAMTMLTHQPAAPTPPQQQAKPEDSPLWRKLFGKRN